MTSSAPIDIIGIGIHTVDMLMVPPAQWHAGGKFPVPSMAVQGGGPAANGLCVCGQLGFASAFIGRMGDDTIGRIAREQFQSCGVSTDWIINCDSRPAVSIIQVNPETAERTIFYNLDGYQHLKSSDIPEALIAGAKVILVDGYEPEGGRRALEIASRSNVRSVLDIEAGDPALALEWMALGTDIIFPLEAAQQLSGKLHPEETLKALQSKTQGQLVITDGDKGSWALTPDGILHQPAFAVEAVDTTGCGDAFHGAYAAGILAEWNLSLRLEFAAWIASRVALHLGGRTALPARQQLKKSDLSNLSKPLQTSIGQL